MRRALRTALSSREIGDKKLGTQVVNLEQQQQRDEETKSQLSKPKKEVAADQKQRSHGMSERIVQKIHVRSLFPLLVGTAVRDESLGL